VPVYPTIASQFNDPGISWMFVNLCRLLRTKLALPEGKWSPALDTSLKEPRATVLIPGARVRYLAEIAEQGRGINAGIEKQADVADRAQSLWEALQELGDPKLPKALELYAANDVLLRAGEGRDGGDIPTPTPTPTPTLPRRRGRGCLIAVSSPCASATTTRCSRSAARTSSCCANGRHG
jgi:methylmalonyl-CoA mutase